MQLTHYETDTCPACGGQPIRKGLPGPKGHPFVHKMSTGRLVLETLWRLVVLVQLYYS